MLFHDVFAVHMNRDSPFNGNELRGSLSCEVENRTLVRCPRLRGTFCVDFSNGILHYELFRRVLRRINKFSPKLRRFPMIRNIPKKQLRIRVIRFSSARLRPKAVHLHPSFQAWFVAKRRPRKLDLLLLLLNFNCQAKRSQR